MKRTKEMHCGLSFIRLVRSSSSSSGVIGAAFSTTDSRFTWAADTVQHLNEGLLDNLVPEKLLSRFLQML